MIRQTCLQIDELAAHHRGERRRRHARRNRLRYIDALIEEFEILNLADEVQVPEALRTRAGRLLAHEGHPFAERPWDTISIAEWMDALYELQDRLMLVVEDGLG